MCYGAIVQIQSWLNICCNQYKMIGSDTFQKRFQSSYAISLRRLFLKSNWNFGWALTLTVIDFGPSKPLLPFQRPNQNSLDFRYSVLGVLVCGIFLSGVLVFGVLESALEYVSQKASNQTCMRLESKSESKTAMLLRAAKFLKNIFNPNKAGLFQGSFSWGPGGQQELI